MEVEDKTVETNDEQKVLDFDRVDLSILQNQTVRSDLQEFLKKFSSELNLSPYGDIASAWLARVWPENTNGEAIVTKLPPKEGKQAWNLRPIPLPLEQSLPIGVNGQIPSFLCIFADGMLVAVKFELSAAFEPGKFDYTMRGRFSCSGWGGCMTAEDQKRLLELPHYAPSTSNRFAKWRAYLDWREKVTEENSKHRYTYCEYKVARNGRGVRFVLRDPQPVDLLRQRLQGQQLIAAQIGSAELKQDTSEEPEKRRRTKKSPAAGTFENVRIVSGRDRQKGAGNWRLKRHDPQSEFPEPVKEMVAVDLRLTEEQRRTYAAETDVELFPLEGELAVDVSGELATLRNQRDAIDRLEAGRVLNVNVENWLFNSQAANKPEFVPTVSYVDSRLNVDQQKSVSKALAAPDVFFLQGPPGTGKTTVIAELCRQMVKENKRTLIASQANLAVDNALSSLSATAHLPSEMRPLRLLDARKEADMEAIFKRFLPDRAVLTWLQSIASEAEHFKNGNCDPRWTTLRSKWVNRLRTNQQGDAHTELRNLYQRYANVVGVTCNKAGRKDFNQAVEFNPSFDLVIVDEVSKATPPELLMPLLLGKKAVLVGDHRQLPPMFRSDSFEEAVANNELKAEDLKRFEELVTASLFEELFTTTSDPLRHTLREQYRMHPHIMYAVNHFYPGSDGNGLLMPGGGLKILDQRKQHGLNLKGNTDVPLLRSDQHVLWIDSTKDENGHLVNEGQKRGTSRWNPLEIEIIAEFLHRIDETDVRGTKLDVGVISFYLAQTNELRERLCKETSWKHLDVQVNTVDQFQGRECSIVIVSLVRCGEVSGEFVKDYRRINVAFSRAKNLLVIVGSRRAFEFASIPIAPVDGGKPFQKRVYKEISTSIAQRGGLREVNQLLRRPEAYGNQDHNRHHRR